MQSLISINSNNNLITTFLAGRNVRTMRTYSQGLNDFRLFVGVVDLDVAIKLLLKMSTYEANACVLAYRQNMQERKLQTSTINNRLAAIRALIKLARMFGLTQIQLEIENLKVESYRDTRGPGSEKVTQMLAKLRLQNNLRSLRDYAITRLLFDLGLRRGEVASLNIEHFNCADGTLQVVGKGHYTRITLTLPKATQEALTSWLNAYKARTGPLFISLSTASYGHRLTGTAIYQIIAQCGELIGEKIRPHGLRHSAITRLLELTNGDVTKVQRFSRHADLRTLTIYDDRRHDIAGEMANLLVNNN